MELFENGTGIPELSLQNLAIVLIEIDSLGLFLIETSTQLFLIGTNSSFCHHDFQLPEDMLYHHHLTHCKSKLFLPHHQNLLQTHNHQCYSRDILPPPLVANLDKFLRSLNC